MKYFILFAFFGFGGISCFSQQKIVADKIVGIVGDKIVLKSEIVQAIGDVVRNGGQAPEDCTVLDGMMIQKALVLQAERDSIPVSEEDVEATIDQKIRYFIGVYGSKEALEQIAGRTIYQLKEDFREPIKEQRLAEGMRNKVVADVRVTPSEVKDYYERIPKDSLHFYESELQIGEIVLYPKASHDIEKLSIDELAEYKRQIEAGSRSFEALAKLYSDDPGSKNNGGEYNLSRTDKQWDPIFMAAAFRLKDGQISPVIKTQFGYHIIQMVSRNGDDAVIRHILRIPQITDAELEVTKMRMDTIRTLLLNGAMPFKEAAVKFSDDPNAKFTAGMKMSRVDNSTYLPIDELDKEIVKLLDSVKIGGYSHPAVFTDERGKKGMHFIFLVSRSDPHRENLKDDYNRIASRALEQKKQDALEKWFRARIPTYYIMIDDDYKQCPTMIKWKTTATVNN
jgi:peptidyl-prolyl cis-trans isomerase SurA